MTALLQIGISLAWGQIATELFFRAWIAFLGMIGCLIFAFASGASRAALAAVFWNRLSQSLFFGLLLFLVFYLLYGQLRLGRSTTEVLVFWISASVRMIFVLYRISPALDRVLDEARRARDRDRLS